MPHAFWLRCPVAALLFWLACASCGYADAPRGGHTLPVEEPPTNPVPAYVTANPAQARWADSMLAAMPLDERIGQLFMVAAYSNRGVEHTLELERLVRDQKVGGLIFFQGGPLRQLRLTNHLQALARVPLMIGIDGEWGLGMRLDSTLSYPKQMTLGAHPGEALIKRMGLDLARQCRRMGIHVNFAPDIDVNSNPLNPVIGTRSFGENRENVALKGRAYMEGLQAGGILACAKHFPGHGDAGADSHYELPVIKQPRKHIEDIDLYPFRKLIQDSLATVMVAHLQIPALDKNAKPSTLSKPIVTGMLRNQLKFEGLVFTDALNMAGAAKFAPSGELEVAALQAGNDVLLFPVDVPKAIAAIRKAIDTKKVSEAELNAHVRRILLAKWWAGLAVPFAALPEANLWRDINQGQTKGLIADCYRAAITVVRDPGAALPFKRLDTSSFVSVEVGAASDRFSQDLAKYARFDAQRLSAMPSAAELQALAQHLAREGRSHTLVVGLHKVNGKAPGYGISAELLAWLQKQGQRHRLVTVVFGNPYAIKGLAGVPGSVVAAFEDNNYTASAAAEALFGAGATGGRMPITLSAVLPDGAGRFTPDARRLSFGEPEQVGLNSDKLARLDTVCRYVCESGIAPGCQVLVARRGRVVYQRSFGRQYYKSAADTAPDRVTDSTLYDIASITKVASTLQAIMFLQERGELDVSAPIAQYMPELAATNKGPLIIADILTHQAGLVPTLIHWEKTQVRPRIREQIVGPPLPEGPVVTLLPRPPAETIPGTRLSDVYYCDQPDTGWFDKTVTPGLYAMRGMEDTLWRWTLQSPLLPPNAQGSHDYLYSDVGFYLLKRLAERKLGQPIDAFMEQNFYQPLGLQTLGFRPLEYADIHQIAPTEREPVFRRRLIRGTVHDPGAAMMGGVAGHAGLFSNALDLAVLMQMNMQEGSYGGCNYFRPGTVPYFAKAHFKRNRRGLGWDKPVLGSTNGPTSRYASAQTFGHTGFTGTCVWADPAQELVFVFLSNRVNPSADNKRLISENIRPKLHDIVYRAILDTNLVAGK